MNIKKHLLIILFVLFLPSCSALTCTYSVSYEVNRAIFEPSVTGNITHYKWNVSQNDGIYNGSTGWVNSTIAKKYIHSFDDFDSITVTLYVKNETLNTSYTSIVESIYEPEYIYEEYDETMQQKDSIGAEPYIPERNPWIPWSVNYDDEAANILFGVVFSVFILIVFLNIKRGNKTILKTKDYIIEFIEEK